MLSKVDFALAEIKRSIVQAKLRSLVPADVSEDLAQSVDALRLHFAADENALDTFVRLRPVRTFTDALLNAMIPPDLCELFSQADAERVLKKAALGRTDYAEAARHRDNMRDIEAQIARNAAGRTLTISPSILHTALASVGCIGHRQGSSLRG